MMELETDCTASCRLVEHGNVLTKCLTKRNISEEKLISFLLLSCGNFSRNSDENGRSALHVACSNSKPNAAEFLLRSGANVNQKDTESNFTPMHRAILYASLDVVVVLKRFGASFDALDSDFYSPLQLIAQPSMLPGLKIETCVNVWGKNKNYNLGIGNTTTRNHPDIIKGLPSVMKASINKYHSLFLTASGALWGCGHNKEGRLGVGAEGTLTLPQEITVKMGHKNERILQVSAGLSHSLVLTNRGVYAAGSNKHLQLGIKNVDSSLVFKEIPLDRSEVDIKSMLNVIACDYHSLFVSRSGVFICGLNVGQFGGIQESIAVPRRLPYPVLPNLEVEWTSSNNCCICVYLSDKKSSYLYIYYNRKMKTYKNPLNEKLKQCVINGGEMLYNSDEIVANSSQKPLTITIMTQHNNIYIWYEDIMQFVKVHMSPLFTLQISSISSCGDDLLLLANSHLFRAVIQHKLSKIYQPGSEFQEYTLKRDIAEFLCSKLSIKRVQYCSNVKEFYCDDSGESFITILSHVAVEVKEPERAVFDFSMLLDEYEFTDSGIMDISFEVKQEIFRANRFVVASRCDYLKKLIEVEAENGSCKINGDKLTPSMFRCILQWIYTNHLSEDEVEIIFGTANNEKLIKQLAEDFIEIITEWNLSGLYNCVISSKPFNKFNHKVMKVKSFKWFSMENLPNLYDVTILLDENQKLRAHKVVLMMRIEYFKMMFHHSWSENSTVDLRHVPINFMKPIIQFAYDNDIESLKKADYTENFMYNMCAILDQYLIEDVKNIFESMIMRKVNLRNCADNLEFSITYNCQFLKQFCMEFICFNLSRLLEGSVLDNVDSDILQELSTFYRQYFKFETDSNRIITPAFDAPTDEEIENIIKDFDFSAYSEAIQQSLKKTSKVKNKLSKSEMLRRNYEKEGMKNMRYDEVSPEPTTPKSPEADKSVTTPVENKSWQKRERKDSAKRKVLTAIKVNEIMKNEEIQHEPMVDLKNFRVSISEEPEAGRSIITLADFGIKSKKKITPVVTPVKVEIPEVKPAWKMDSLELKAPNLQTASDPFKVTPAKKKASTPKASSTEKNFTSIVRSERKDKLNYEKIKSKSLILTQIEEKAIMDLAEFYNIDNIFDENIKIERKVHFTSQNLSQWQHGA